MCHEPKLEPCSSPLPLVDHLQIPIFQAILICFALGQAKISGSVSFERAPFRASVATRAQQVAQSRGRVARMTWKKG